MLTVTSIVAPSVSFVIFLGGGGTVQRPYETEKIFTIFGFMKPHVYMR